MEWPSVFVFFVSCSWAGVTVGIVLHFMIYYVSAKYVSNFDGRND